MDTNEIMVTEEVIEATENITTAGLGKGYKIAVGVGLAVFAGVIAYKYIVKPMAAKIKAKKDQSKSNAEANNFKDTEIVYEINKDE